MFCLGTGDKIYSVDTALIILLLCVYVCVFTKSRKILHHILTQGGIILSGKSAAINA